MSAFDAGEDVSKLEVLVVDSGAIIKGHGNGFHLMAKRLVTIEEVISEIRDSKSRDMLLKLPFELEICSPSEEAMLEVGKFAKKSGDFASLSLVDLKVMALAYTLEVEMYDGGKHIRTEPIDNKTLQWRQEQLAAGKSAELPKRVVKAKAFEGAELESSSGVKEVDEGEDEEDEVSIEELTQDEAMFENEEHLLDGEAYEEEREYDDYEDEGEEGEEEKGEEEEPFELRGEDFPEGFGDSAEPTPTLPAGDWGRGVPKTTMEGERGGGSAPEVVAQQAKPSTSSTLSKSRTFDAAAYFSRDASHELHQGGEEAGDAPTNTLLLPHTSSAMSEAAPMTSRIIGSSGGGGTAESQRRAALEDDGQGWIHSGNMQRCLNTGTGLLGSNTLKVKSRDLQKHGNKAAKGEEEEEEEGFAEVKKKKSKSKSKATPGKGRGANKNNPAQAASLNSPRPVGCVTTDFTMQNVLLQMNLHLVSVDGMQIQGVKQWVVRCMACYTIHYDMDRLFCSRCGANHMSRVACSIDAKTGELRLHLKKGYMPNRRGKQHSLPLPGKQGRFQGELLLREDQLMSGIWRQKVVKMQKDVKSAFGHDVTGDVGVHVNKSQAIKVGLGRFNPNADKGRERRGAKKKGSKK